MSEPSTKTVMLRVQELYDKSGKTLDQIGLDMGYPISLARKSVWQFLNKTSDPRLSMLEKFAKAIGVPLVDLFEVPKGKKTK